MCSNYFFSSSVTYILIYIKSVLSCLLSRSLFRFGGRVWAEPDNDQRARKGCFGLCLLQRIKAYSDWLQVINCTDLRIWKRKTVLRFRAGGNEAGVISAVVPAKTDYRQTVPLVKYAGEVATQLISGNINIYGKDDLNG